MIDLTSTIIAKSDQLNSDDLIGRTITVVITKVSLLAGDQPISISYEGDAGKPWKPCKGMRRVLVHCWGADGNQYIGRSMTLHRDPDVTWAGAKVGGIRITHMSHINGKVTMALTASRGNKKPYEVRPLTVSSSAAPLTPTGEIYEAGKAAASQGMQEFTDWGKSLTPEQRANVQPHLAALTKAAKEADADKGEVA